MVRSYGIKITATYKLPLPRFSNACSPIMNTSFDVKWIMTSSVIIYSKLSMFRLRFSQYISRFL